MKTFTATQEITGLLQKGTEFEGRLSFVGTLKIGGIFKGEIISDGVLIIDEDAEVNADISVGEAIIKGRVQGTLKAQRMVNLLSPAYFKGIISSPNLKIDEGVHFDGSSAPPEN